MLTYERKHLGIHYQTLDSKKYTTNLLKMPSLEGTKYLIFFLALPERGKILTRQRAALSSAT